MSRSPSCPRITSRSASTLSSRASSSRGTSGAPVVFDFGQNVVGWTRIETATLEKGDILVRHGEALTPAKRVWRDNLRTAQQEDRYTPGEAGQYVLEPRHTVHGFRYAEVWGAPAGFYLGEGAPPRAMAIALDGGQRRVGSFECSDPELTELSRAIEWTIRDNSLEVLSDCPQRDERLGWLGDGSVIAPTAAYYFDFGAFLSKIAADVADGLAPDGMVPSYVPWVPGTNPDGAPGWSDGFVRLVHLSAERYGDVGDRPSSLPGAPTIRRTPGGGPTRTGSARTGSGTTSATG
jgi:Bacterial alpha-L-rhamnosidase.